MLSGDVLFDASKSSPEQSSGSRVSSHPTTSNANNRCGISLFIEFSLV